MIFLTRNKIGSFFKNREHREQKEMFLMFSVLVIFIKKILAKKFRFLRVLCVLDVLGSRFFKKKIFTLHRDASTKSPPLVSRVQSTVDEIVRAILRLSGRKRTKRIFTTVYYIVSCNFIPRDTFLRRGRTPKSHIFQRQVS